MSELKLRSESAMPYQTWKPFPDDAIVKVWSYYEDVPPTIDLVKNLWWGYEIECTDVAEGVIARAMLLSKRKEE